MTRPALLALALAVLAAPALAHHGTGQYDFAKDVTLKGRVKAYDFMSPHIWLTLETDRPGGGAQAWSLEGPPPAYAIPRGWKADSLKPGQAVTVVMSPLRDGSPAGIILTVAEPGGKVLLERGRRY
jgi:hypothetical protein